jgi:hypothetical protein
MSHIDSLIEDLKQARDKLRLQIHLGSGELQDEWADDAVLRVSLSALFRAGGEWAVFRISEGKAGCCQSNANRSPKSVNSRFSGRKLTPFGHSGRAVLLEDIAAV